MSMIGPASTRGIPAVRELVRLVTADDGYRLKYRVWRGPAPNKTVVLLHGLMSHSKWFRNIAEPMASSGGSVIGPDRRGSGLNRIDRGDAPSAATLVADVWRIIEREHNPETPLYIAGWCWGAVLALNVLGDARRIPSGLVLMAPGIFPSAEVVENLAAEKRRPSSVNEAPLRSPIREEMFTQGKWLDGFILRDKMRVRFFTRRFEGIMREMGAIASRQLYRVALPVLLLLAGRDAVVDNCRTLDAFGRISKAAVTTASIDCEHGMQFEAPEELVARILPWLEQHASPVIPHPVSSSGNV